MDMLNKLIVDGSTGKSQIVPFTEEETAAHLAEQKKIADEKAALITKEKAKAEAKAIAESKLAALGLTAEDLKALGL
jgi:hypothetical protein